MTTTEERVAALGAKTKGPVILTMQMLSPTSLNPAVVTSYSIYLAVPGLNYLGSSEEEVLSAAERET